MTNPSRRSVKIATKDLLLTTLVAGLSYSPALAQPVATAAPVVFEAARVQVSAKNPSPYALGNDLGGNRYEFRNATMVDLINAAYGVAVDKIVGGPSWLESDRFDVAAQAPPATAREVLNRMLQSLLADRFNLMVHTHSRPQPTLALARMNGTHKLKPANPTGKPGCTRQPVSAADEAPSLAAVCRNITIEAFVQQLPTMVGTDYVPSRVTDLTGLKGSWDFDLKWTPRPSLERAGANGITIHTALENQAGLTLRPTAIPTPVLVVDRADRIPRMASPLIPALPPSAPPTFEVAVIKLSSPETRGKNQLLVRNNGQADIQGVTLKRLIKVAWQDTMNDWMTGGPAFLDSTRYDISAKFPERYHDMALQADLIEPTLRALLKDRFKVAVHREDREVSVYTLLTTKPKLTPADPASRTACKTGPAPLTSNLASGAMRMTTCTNMTMADFADGLQRIANGYIDTPVFDATGLTGSFDFNLTYSRAGALQIAPAANGAVAEAADPNGAISLMDALSQLGLKLEKQKHKMPVLVIDHAEETPTEN